MDESFGFERWNAKRRKPSKETSEQREAEREKRRQDAKNAAESAEGSMTARQKARLEEKFSADDSLKHHGGSSGLAEQLNELGDGKTVCAHEVAGWWDKKQKASKRRTNKGGEVEKRQAEEDMRELSLSSDPAPPGSTVALWRPWR